ncbi:zinc finger, RING/FYVE/PHD-type containing protein [Tanacetum coccineum]
MDQAFQSDGLAKNEEEEEQVQVMELDQEEEEWMDLNYETEEDIEDEEEKEKEKEKDDDEDVYKNLVLLPRVTGWYDHVTGKTDHGIQVMNVRLSTDCKKYEFDRCPICLKPLTHDKIHQLCCLPCGHMFGMSCIKQWMEDRSRDKCPQCNKFFLLESVRLLYATRLCIPSAADRKASIRRFSFNKKGFTTFKQYERELRTNALNNRSDALKQRADVLGRQNVAMKRRTKLLKRMAVVEKRADGLERKNDAMKRQTELLNRMTDEEEWTEASEQRAEALRHRADALGQRADEYLRIADVFGQQAKALRQQAKALRQLVDSYLASMKFYKQSYKEFLGLHDKRITE